MWGEQKRASDKAHCITAYMSEMYQMLHISETLHAAVCLRVCKPLKCEMYLNACNDDSYYFLSNKTDERNLLHLQTRVRDA